MLIELRVSGYKCERFHKKVYEEGSYCGKCGNKLNENRKLEIQDGDLLEFALGLLGMSRQALIDKNNSRKERV